MLNKSRRTLLKGLAYGSALSVSGISGLALAKSNERSSDAIIGDILGDIHLLPTQHSDTKSISLFNHTDKDVVIDGIDKLKLDGDNQFLAVRVNTSDMPMGVTLTPGESREFAVAATSSDYHAIKAKNAAAFNGIVPVTLLGSQAA